MKIRLVLQFLVAAFCGSMVSRVQAAEAPPPGYQYILNSSDLTAMNVVTNTPFGDVTVYADPTRDDKIALAFIDENGVAIYGIWQSLGIGFSEPFDSIAFDISASHSDTGNSEYAGYSKSYTVQLSNGDSLTHSEMEVNGEFHVIDAEADADGNIISSSLAKNQSLRRSDRCDLLSDYGEIYCPSSVRPIPIPTNVRSVIQSAGWFSSALHAVASAVDTAGKATFNVLKDPVVQAAVMATITIAAILVCTLITGTVLLATCVYGAVATDVLVTSQIYNSMSYNTDVQRGQLTSAAGYISCEQTNCLYQTQKCDIIDSGCPF